MAGERPLVVVSDETLLDEVLRLAAAVGCELERAPDLISAGGSWQRAPLVLVGEDVLADGVDLPRRAGILLVTKGAPAPSIWERAFAAGVQQVLPLPDSESAIVGALADVVEGPVVPGGCVIGVVGGRGGAGASVLAAALALAAQASSALLVDCDPLGGGLDLLLGKEKASGSRWPDLSLDGGRIALAELESALPRYEHAHGRFAYVSCDRVGKAPTAEAIASVVDAGLRAGKTVICDLPRRLDDLRPVITRADIIVTVVPAELRACVAARRVVASLGDRVDRAKLVVRGPAPGDLHPAEAAHWVQIPLLASMAPERHLGRSLDSGAFDPRPRGPLMTAARTVLAAARTPATAAA